MTVSVKLYSGGSWTNHIAVLGCATTLLPTIMEFPRAIQMTSRAVLKGFPKRQFFENRRDNTQQNAERSCFCNTTWTQTSWRVVISLLWHPTGAVFEPFLPRKVRFLDVFIRVFIAEMVVKIDHSPKRIWSPSLPKSSRMCFFRQSIKNWLNEYVNIDFSFSSFIYSLHLLWVWWNIRGGCDAWQATAQMVQPCIFLTKSHEWSWTRNSLFAMIT